ncbi:MAG: GNAT family N-acetyltransferase [Streptosporangiales bacterium]
MTQSPYPIRPIAADELDHLAPLLDLAFHETHRPEEFQLFWKALELDRSLAAFDGDRMISSAAAFSLSMTLPGTTAPVAGVTIVVVHPAYRRQGVLSSVMGRQLADLRDGGEAVAALWASESAIYGRFGYAIACQRAMINVRRGEGALVPDAPSSTGIRLDLATPDDALPAMRKVYEETGATRPGHVARTDAFWADSLYDPEHRREGATPLQALLAYGDGDVRGYALYKVSPSHDGTVNTSTVRLEELHASDPAAYVACWKYLASLDLTSEVVCRHMPVDAPLFSLLADPRRARVQVGDALWVRLVRVGEALAQRCYAAPVDLVLDITDNRCGWNAGRWRLSGDESGATCERTTDAPDLRVDTTVLAAGYLGGTALGAYGVSGRAVEERPGALRRLSTAMSWDPRPYCVHQF